MDKELIELLKYALTIFGSVIVGGVFTFLAKKSADNTQVKIAEIDSQKALAVKTQDEVEKLRSDVIRLTATVAELTVKLNTALSRMEDNNISTRGIL